MKNKPEYTVHFIMSRHRGCMLERAFPWEVHDSKGKVAQYGKTKQSCIDWIEQSGGFWKENKIGEVIAR